MLDVNLSMAIWVVGCFFFIIKFDKVLDRALHTFVLCFTLLNINFTLCVCVRRILIAENESIRMFVLCLDVFCDSRYVAKVGITYCVFLT